MEQPLNLSDYASYKQYFAKLAREHKELGEDNYLFGDEAVGQSESADWVGKKLWAWPADQGKLQDQRSDSLLFVKEGSLWIGGNPSSGAYNDVDAYYASCERVGKQILSRMVRDKGDGLISCDFSSGSVRRSDMHLGSTLFVGCEVSFSFYDPTGFEYDLNQWI